jgi:hypothetical protein
LIPQGRDTPPCCTTPVCERACRQVGRGSAGLRRDARRIMLCVGRGAPIHRCRVFGWGV